MQKCFIHIIEQISLINIASMLDLVNVGNENSLLAQLKIFFLNNSVHIS